MLYVVWLLIDNIEFAGGAGGRLGVLQPDPVAGRSATFVVGLLGVLLLRARSPEVYRAIGRTVFEEAHERE